MNRGSRFRRRCWGNFLYARGDEPKSAERRLYELLFSLRTWRWTVSDTVLAGFFSIFSTHVEMNRVRRNQPDFPAHFLYARGDEPLIGGCGGLYNKFSLRTWRWTVLSVIGNPRKLIFSTHVEMNRRGKTRSGNWQNFLYARGDEPITQIVVCFVVWFSLRTWRWTDVLTRICRTWIIFSTHVEMNRFNHQR